MTETLTGRLILAGLLTIILHAAGLSWHLHQSQVISSPKPMAAQSIIVSLITRSMSPEKQEKSERMPEVIPEIPTLEKPELEPVPTPEKLVPRSKKIVIKSTTKMQPPNRQTAVTPLSMSPYPKENADKETKETASRVIQTVSPLYQLNPPPKYPRLAKRRGIEGVVILEALISTYGKVKTLHVFKSSGHSILDKAALNAVQYWKFSPGMINGRAKEMLIRVPVRFKLSKS